MSSEQLAKFIVRMPRSAMLFTVHLVTDTQFHRFMANAMHRAAHSMKQTLVTFTQCTTLSHIYTAVHAKHLVTVSVGKKAATYSCFPQTHFPRPPPSLHVSHPSILSTLLDYVYSDISEISDISWMITTEIQMTGFANHRYHPSVFLLCVF